MSATLVKSLANSIALVTGASSGLGRHFATVLANAGATMALAARRTEQLEELARSIEATGGRALAVRMDVTSGESVRTAFDRIEATLGTPDLIVNTAGIVIAKPLLEQTEADWDAVLDTNLKGAFLVSTDGARRLRMQRRSGSIINIASILGFRQAGNVTPYATSKAGMVQLTRSMALELARFDIRVNAIAPGYVDTEMNSEFWGTPQGAEMLKRIPQRRLGKPEELDGALLLLASNTSTYMTGTVITVDGGHLVSTL
jgi:NAD(P)-dependent dehydrogenase (short-subunit alcohol dehydrogenase family)